MADPTGFVTYDHLTHPPLADRGWKVTDIPWDAPGIDWSAFDAAVIRSPWDYQRDPQRFLAVLGTIEEAGARLFNPLVTVSWNIHKSYLRELEDKGVTIVPTVWLPSLDAPAIARARAQHGCGTLVVKPPVGANADDTFVLESDASVGAALDRFGSSELMVQPFLPAIRDEGEHSLFYFGGEFSHAVIKRPKRGDFRVQEEHGGQIEATAPAGDLIAAASGVISCLPSPLLYARVDLVRLPDGTPALMEVELIEPSLYFPYDPGAAGRYAAALDHLCYPCP